MPARSVIYQWLNSNPGFADKYARARVLRMEALVERVAVLSEEALELATGENANARVHARKLEIDTLKWILAKEYSRNYGDRVSHEVTGADGGAIRTEATYKLTTQDEELITKARKARGKIVDADPAD